MYQQEFNGTIKKHFLDRKILEHLFKKKKGGTWCYYLYKSSSTEADITQKKNQHKAKYKDGLKSS